MDSLKAKKKYSQNFLRDKNILKKIFQLLDINEKDFVLEVGPGDGALSFEIQMKTNNYKAIEIDERAIQLLSKTKLNQHLINADFMKIDIKQFERYDYFISNLPYNLASRILFKSIKSENFEKIAFMVQKEMGQRIIAKKNTKEYGRLSVMIQNLFIVEGDILVDRKCFVPSPNVDSMFIKLKRKNINIKDIEAFENFVKISFSERRKIYLSKLKKQIDKNKLNKIKQFLIKNNYDLNIRAEDIKSSDFLHIWEEIN